ncbi:hypothetical protein BGZ63DRAFT_395457 [Mariannaea sp. PMI_226]|nr:hypothetical protein BGZ63DRAFT_395457 [Mariannaea sp. PMI_226]
MEERDSSIICSFVRFYPILFYFICILRIYLFMFSFVYGVSIWSVHFVPLFFFLVHYGPQSYSVGISPLGDMFYFIK